MALGDAITIRLLRAIAGLGDKDAIIATTETVATQNQRAAGHIADYAGPVLPGITQVITHSAAGNRDIDLSVGDLFIVNLSANITNLTFSNMPQNARPVIVFAQDATGGRTITARGSMIRNAGNAMPLSATGNLRDLYHFVVVGAFAVEMSRALSQPQF